MILNVPSLFFMSRIASRRFFSWAHASCELHPFKNYQQLQYSTSRGGAFASMLPTKPTSKPDYMDIINGWLWMILCGKQCVSFMKCQHQGCRVKIERVSTSQPWAWEEKGWKRNIQLPGAAKFTFACLSFHIFHVFLYVSGAWMNLSWTGSWAEAARWKRQPGVKANRNSQRWSWNAHSPLRASKGERKVEKRK